MGISVANTKKSNVLNFENLKHFGGHVSYRGYHYVGNNLSQPMIWLISFSVSKTLFVCFTNNSLLNY